jgi:hypothetical protein
MQKLFIISVMIFLAAGVVHGQSNIVIASTDGFPSQVALDQHIEVRFDFSVHPIAQMDSLIVSVKEKSGGERKLEKLKLIENNGKFFLNDQFILDGRVRYNTIFATGVAAAILEVVIYAVDKNGTKSGTIQLSLQP